MIFGKIDYLNLLPFSVFLKGCRAPNAFKAALNYHKGVPSAMSEALVKGRIDAAVISSVEARRARFKRLELGICAQAAVKSVLVRLGEKKPDAASRTSNALSEILGVEGEVVIGDRALRLYLQEWRKSEARAAAGAVQSEAKGGLKNAGILRKDALSDGKTLSSCNKTPNGGQTPCKAAKRSFYAGKKSTKQQRFFEDEELKDLGLLWRERTNLPFVFGLFSAQKGEQFFTRLVRSFNKRPVKIPRYILAEYAAQRGVSEADILWYLGFIHYKITTKERLSLRLFYRLARQNGVKTLR
mgnify:CR=1 FL=1